MTRIAVIVPLLCRTEHLGACIDSLLAQTRVPDDIIVVECPPAGAASLLGAYGERVTHVVASGTGRAAARNTGLRATTCELVAFLDADHVAATDRIEWQLDVFASDPEIVLSHGALVAIDRWPSGGAEPAPDASQHVPIEQQLGRLVVSNHIATNTVCVRRDVVAALGGFCETPGVRDDYDLWLRMATRGRFHYVDVPLAVSRPPVRESGDDAAEMANPEAGALVRLDWSVIENALRAAYPQDEARALVEAEVLVRREEFGVAEMRLISLARQPHAAGALFHLAPLMMRRGSLDYAEAVLRRALGDEPDDAALWNNLGVVLVRRGRADEAADAFARAVDLQPRDEDATANLEQILHGRSGVWRISRTRMRTPFTALAAAA